jgi:predicted dienelactone hydrolase
MKIIAVCVALFTSIFSSTAHAYTEDRVSVPDGNGESIPLHVWLPDSAARSAIAHRLPLVIMSHGAGGSGEDFEDSARALANAGFVVASITHPGDNYRDKSHVQSGTNLSSRPRHVSRAIDYMLTGWPAHAQIDPARIGLFGFSAGGFTALVIAGAKPDLSRFAEHCRNKPDSWDCSYLRQTGAPIERAPIAAGAWVRDARVKAAVIAAPALGYSFEPNGLVEVRTPIQLWRGERDSVTEDSAESVRRLLPAAPEYHLVANSGHFAFMRPCDWKLRAIIGVMTWFGTEDICTDPEGFDRQRFHDEFNRSVVQFFSSHLQGNALGPS